MKPPETGSDEPRIFLVSNEGVVVDAHEDACAALGWSREEILNKGVSDLLEYGYDLLRERLGEVEATAETSFSITALVRRKDQTNFPASAVVRLLPHLNCFTLAFQDVGNEDVEAPAAATEVAVTKPIEAPVKASTPVVETPNVKGTPVVAANSNGNTPNFRNVQLCVSKKAPSNAEATEAAKNAAEAAAQLETERQERRRLEARIVSLNDQLLQLHAQLKTNLESENVYRERARECEAELQKAEESRVAAAASLDQEQQQRARLTEEVEQLKLASAQAEDARETQQEEVFAKLESILTAFQESDSRFEKELTARRSLHESLRMLQRDIGDDSVTATVDAPAQRIPKTRVNREMKPAVEAANPLRPFEDA